MSQPHQFEAEHFRITGMKIQLLRSRFPFRTIDFQEISRISIKKGIRVKRPLLAFLFGAGLIYTSLYVLLSISGILDSLREPYEGSSAQGYKFFGALLVMGGFLLVLGAVSVYQAMIPTWILYLELEDGSREVLDLRKLFHTNEVFKLAQFLRYNFPSERLIIDKRIA